MYTFLSSGLRLFCMFEAVFDKLGTDGSTSVVVSGHGMIAGGI